MHKETLDKSSTKAKYHVTRTQRKNMGFFSAELSN